MFGLFKSKKPAEPATGVAALMQIFEDLSAKVEAAYVDVKKFSRPEISFFAMSAISVYIQAGDVPENIEQELLTQFTERALASMLVRLPPPASSDMLYSVFVTRFGEYAELIAHLAGASEANHHRDAVFALMSALDKNAKVEADAVMAMMRGLKIGMPLTHAELNVRDAVIAYQSHARP
ncbi:hypothetical protein [Devosia sp. Root436]|uniref:hypothetical protein n=1 Tax=Devosia sp. Root436 TaxID=1736537 RepID=UPI000A5B368A|nr:hypothetical protein [Devosia sp. Root436]